MSVILLASILIRLGAMAWSIVLLRRVRDLRMGFLTAMLALMAIRQLLTLTRSVEAGSTWQLSIGRHLDEVPGLLVSVLAALSVVFLERLIAQHRRDAQAILKRDRELQQARKMEAMGQLAGGIAHDFNNLLMVIMSNAALARRSSSKPDKVAEHLHELEAASERAADLTRQLLTFARKRVPERKPADLNAIVKELQPMMQRLIPERIALVVRLADSVPPVDVDASQIGQVLMNLIVNGQQAIDGQGTITIETRSIGDTVHVSVSDTGTGISPDTQQRIFEPFFTTKPQGEGSGLGLAICFSILGDHGGQIEVDSELDRGTTFHLTLPATSGQIPSEAPNADTPHGADEPSGGDEPSGDDEPPGGDERILVVEDELQVRAVTCATLASLGYRVCESEDGIEALAQLQKMPDVALVLTDVMMPRLGGVELRSRLLQQRPGLPVLLMTGYSSTPLELEQGVLAKPFTRQQLAIAVREMIDESAPSAAADA